MASRKALTRSKASACNNKAKTVVPSSFPSQGSMPEFRIACHCIFAESVSMLLKTSWNLSKKRGCDRWLSTIHWTLQSKGVFPWRSLAFGNAPLSSRNLAAFHVCAMWRGVSPSPFAALTFAPWEINCVATWLRIASRCDTASAGLYSSWKMEG